MSGDRRLFIGRLTQDVRQRDLEDLFTKFGPIKQVTLKSSYGFVEFEDARDAKDALVMDGTKLEGNRIAVEMSYPPNERRDGRDNRVGRDSFARRDDRGGGYDRGYDRGGYDRGYDRGRDRDRDDRRGGGGKGRFSPPRNTDYRVVIENLPSGCSWQDLKDHFRTIGDVCFSDVRRGRDGRQMGVIEYKHYDDMKQAVKELDGSRLHGATIDVFSDYTGRSRSRSRTRSRSPKKETKIVPDLLHQRER
jgi:RNA recognition motif-containing protein